jgi:hypothetical protein
MGEQDARRDVEREQHRPSFAAVGVAMRIGFLVRRTRRFLATASRAPARIAQIKVTEQEWPAGGGDSQAHTDYHYTYAVEFTAAAAGPVRFWSRGAHINERRYRTGETVTVVYDPADAAGTAEIDSAVVWLPVVKMGALLTLLTVSGIVAKAC